MLEHELISKYKSWMYQLVNDERYTLERRYSKLFDALYDIPFTYTINMDANRADDGVNLRYRFGYECRCSDSCIANFLDAKQCSVLEMMIALALRCEEAIMDDPDYGNRTGQWFWSMINSLGLMGMHDDSFDAEMVDLVINRFLNHWYDRDGRGGLFTVPYCNDDLRTVEIWYQMNWYLNSLLSK